MRAYLTAKLRRFGLNAKKIGNSCIEVCNRFTLFWRPALCGVILQSKTATVGCVRHNPNEFGSALTCTTVAA